jgi:predicted anti-sigma-YlaC factor YlaD
MDQRCDEYRIALSARLDGEQTGVPSGALEAHLAACAECATWLAGAERVTQTVRAHREQAPDLTERILTAIHASERRATRGRTLAAPNPRRRRMLQIALGLSAAIQLALAMPMLLGFGDAAHTSREAASFDIALAVGFALAAWWPERARAFVPVAFVLAVCLTLTSAFDIAEGATMFAHEIGHVAALAQAGLLWALSRNNAPMSPKAREAATS